MLGRAASATRLVVHVMYQLRRLCRRVLGNDIRRDEPFVPIARQGAVQACEGFGWLMVRSTMAVILTDAVLASRSLIGSRLQCPLQRPYPLLAGRIDRGLV